MNPNLRGQILFSSRRSEALEQDIRSAYVTLKNLMQNREKVSSEIVSMDDCVFVLGSFKGGELS